LFDQRYRPVLVAFAMRQGISEDEAADVAQTALAQFISDYSEGKYDRSRGRLSSWIIGIARNRVADVRRGRQRQRQQRGESAFCDLPEQGDETRHWEEAQRMVILDKGMAILRDESKLDPRTIKAFDLCAVRNVPPEAAAQECGMTVSEVYVAKNRAVKKLREIVAELTQEFDEE
jgi:RNA polymerase sigma-70 factor (ECF subfamily)